jgi:hypothetical protein
MAISKSLHDEIKEKWFPEGHSLDTDRGREAQEVFTEKEVKKFEAWKKDHAHSDLKGFDTPDAKELTPRQVVKKITGRRSGEDAILDEPSRFTDPKTGAGADISKYSKQIRDFNSFKQVVKQAWGQKHGDSIKNLYDDISKGNLDEVLKTLYLTKQVQSWLNENRKPDMIKAIMQRFGVEQQRAIRVFDRLSPSAKEKLLTRVIKSKEPRLVREPKKGISKRINIPMIRQVSSKGKQYSRAKPKRWTDMQTRFLKNNRSLPLDNLIERYNMVFAKERRTISSLKNKIYRLKR